MQTDRVRVASTVRASISADGLVLLDLERGLVLASSPVGARIWQLLEQQLSLTEIANHLAHDYGIPTDRATGDVRVFTQSLLERGLVIQERA